MLFAHGLKSTTICSPLCHRNGFEKPPNLFSRSRHCHRQGPHCCNRAKSWLQKREGQAPLSSPRRTCLQQTLHSRRRDLLRLRRSVCHTDLRRRSVSIQCDAIFDDLGPSIWQGPQASWLLQDSSPHYGEGTSSDCYWMSSSDDRKQW